MFSLFSCASHKYYGDRYDKNTQVVIKSNNVSDFVVQVFDDKVKRKRVAVKGEAKVNLILRNKTTKLILTHPNYDSDSIIFKRKVRSDALIKDIALSLFTLGIPLIVDMGNPDFYKISEDSKYHDIVFNYKQSYMVDEYNKISKSIKPEVYEGWIERYQKSNIINLVIDKKDSLELQIAIDGKNEKEIDNFIESHEKSSFLEEALIIKNQMQKAREDFNTAKKENTVESYEKFLNDYPKSLHDKEALNLLIDAAEKKAIRSKNIEELTSYAQKYLINNLSIIEANKIPAKRDSLTKYGEAFLMKTCLNNSSKENYYSYSKLWIMYRKFINDVSPNLIGNMNSIKIQKDSICELLFNELPKIKSIQGQEEFEKKITSDFPDLFSNSKGLISIENILNSQQKAKGSINYFNNYFLGKYLIKNNQDSCLSYLYKDKKYFLPEIFALSNLNFDRGKLTKAIVYEENGNLLFSCELNDKEITLLNYYQQGILVKTIYKTKKGKYFYDFEDGKNLTISYYKEEFKKIIEYEIFLKSALKNKFNDDLVNKLRTEFDKYSNSLNYLLEVYNSNQIPDKEVIDKFNSSGKFLKSFSPTLKLKMDEYEGSEKYDSYKFVDNKSGECHKCGRPVNCTKKSKEVIDCEIMVYKQFEAVKMLVFKPRKIRMLHVCGLEDDYMEPDEVINHNIKIYDCPWFCAQCKE